MPANHMQRAFARLEAHRRELEAQIVFEMEAKYLNRKTPRYRITASHDGRSFEASFDNEETSTGNDSHTTVCWEEDE